MTELPRWDIVPERRPREFIPIPESPDNDWCSLVNYLYGGQGDYRTELMADAFLVAKTTPLGVVIPGDYERKEPVDEGGSTRHQIAGFFSSISIRPHLEGQRRPLRRLPFVRLAQAHDVDAGVPLSRYSGQHVLVPLVGVDLITLERQVTG